MITDSQLEQGRIVAIKALRTLVERDEIGRASCRERV